nr:unnamed protein product [Digitaria exilis]
MEVASAAKRRKEEIESIDARRRRAGGEGVAKEARGVGRASEALEELAEERRGGRRDAVAGR